jgi:hypothetical protein
LNPPPIDGEEDAAANDVAVARVEDAVDDVEGLVGWNETGDENAGITPNPGAIWAWLGAAAAGGRWLVELDSERGNLAGDREVAGAASAAVCACAGAGAGADGIVSGEGMGDVVGARVGS